MKRISMMLLAATAMVLVLHSCKKDETVVSPPLPGNEFLTTVQLVITNNANAADVQTKSVKELPGQPINYSNATISLKKNATYSVKVKFLDETKNPVGDITEDILARQNYHLICFAVTGANLTVVRTDLDTNTPALQVGLQDRFTTTAVSTGSLNVRLRHQPNAKNGSCDPGSSDADVDFPVNIIN